MVDLPAIEQAKLALERALSGTGDERWFEAIGALQSALSDLGLRAVVVGGLAVQYWTKGRFTTADADILLPSSQEVEDRLTQLGFERSGRHWAHPAGDLQLELPGDFLEGTR